MQQQVFPVLGDEKELPLYVIGIGVEYRQFPINRPSGYEFPAEVREKLLLTAQSMS